MKSTRRMKRMARNHKKRLPAMNLTSLMDVFTILVFFLLVNSAASEVLEPPKKISLPDSVVETKPAETAVVMVSDEAVLVQGEAVIALTDVVASKQENIPEISERLKEVKGTIIGVSTKTVAESSKVTILSHKTIPFKVLQKVMTSCAIAGYGTINLAVIQKASQS
jgi:biopolymer transport protein ExbD